jgi:hypothetical protein
MPIDNDDWGSTNGHILFEMDNANDHILSDFTIEAYFSKDEIHPLANTPNWFDYWSQIPIIQDLLDAVPGIPLYDSNNCAFTPNPGKNAIELIYDPNLTFNPPPARTTFGLGKGNQIDGGMTVKENLGDYGNKCEIGTLKPGAAVGYRYPFRIYLGEGCSKRKDRDGRVPNGTHTIRGIDVFYSVLIHEVEHLMIECEVWSPGYMYDFLDTMDSRYDIYADRDKDGYRDAWELMVNINNPSLVRFSIAKKDPITGTLLPPFDRYNVDPLNGNSTTTYNLSLLGQPWQSVKNQISAGTYYEENRCRDEELNFILNQIHPYDWSFDPSKQDQGKNW